MWNRIVSAVVSVVFLLISTSCHAGEKRYADHVSALVSQTGYVQFTPEIDILPGLAFPSQVIGSAWAVKCGWDYKIVTAQHVALGTMPVPGVLEVCSNEHKCVTLDRLDGVGPVVGQASRHDWIYWEVDRLPKGLKSSRIAHDYAIGDPVCVVGAALGRVGEVTCGAVTNDVGDFAYIDARVLPGNSGGPVFDDKGHVLGMVIAMDSPVDQGMAPVSTSGLVLEAGSIWF